MQKENKNAIRTEFVIPGSQLIRQMIPIAVLIYRKIKETNSKKNQGNTISYELIKMVFLI